MNKDFKTNMDDVVQNNTLDSLRETLTGIEVKGAPKETVEFNNPDINKSEEVDPKLLESIEYKHDEIMDKEIDEDFLENKPLEEITEEEWEYIQKDTTEKMSYSDLQKMIGGINENRVRKQEKYLNNLILEGQKNRKNKAKRKKRKRVKTKRRRK